jgi:hypothetical protein
MNNEPVAWIEEDGMVRFDAQWASQMQGKEPIALYDRPAKTLTDEEILNLFEHKYDVEIDDEMLIDFARAILRKAQEK